MKTRSSLSTSADGQRAAVRAVLRPAAIAAIVALTLCAPGVLAQRGDAAQDVLERAVDDFLAGRVTQSAAGFDRVVTLAPNTAPRLWQRGIALYYAGRYEDCRAQFELHRTVNPNDVENAVWHFLCVAAAGSVERARAAILPVGRDPRVPMREIYEMFRGRMSPESVLVAAGDDLSARFYANLYVGLYQEAHGIDRAGFYINNAAHERYAAVGGYMNAVARVHMQVRKERGRLNFP